MTAPHSLIFADTLVHAPPAFPNDQLDQNLVGGEGTELGGFAIGPRHACRKINRPKSLCSGTMVAASVFSDLPIVSRWNRTVPREAARTR